jgi:hypothetical protein
MDPFELPVHDHLTHTAIRHRSIVADQGNVLDIFAYEGVNYGFGSAYGHESADQYGIAIIDHRCSFV